MFDLDDIIISHQIKYLILEVLDPYEIKYTAFTGSSLYPAIHQHFSRGHLFHHDQVLKYAILCCGDVQVIYNGFDVDPFCAVADYRVLAVK